MRHSGQVISTLYVTMKIVKNQSACESQGVEPVPTQPGSKVGIAISTVGQTPVNAMRHSLEKGTNGWYIWSGDEFSEEDGFTVLRRARAEAFGGP